MGSGFSAKTIDIDNYPDDYLMEIIANAYLKAPERMERIFTTAKLRATEPDVTAVVPEASCPLQSNDVASAVVEEMNLARETPTAYADYVEMVLSFFGEKEDDVMRKPDSNIGIKTNEGKAAVIECCEYLRSYTAVGPLCLDTSLSQAACDHAADLGETGLASHTGNDGSSMGDRIERHGEWGGTIGENICFGNEVARDIVIQMLIDDGVANRGHRNNILNGSFHVVGVSVQKHKHQQFVCVVDFAGSYGPKVEKLGSPLSATAQGEITEDLAKIIASIPFEDLKLEVKSVLVPGDQRKVTMNYTPTSIEVIFTNPDGSSLTQSGTWGTKSAC